MPAHRSSVIDRSILRCCRVVDLGVNSGYSTEPTGHHQLLPREYLSGNDQSKWAQRFDFPPFFPTAILSTKPCDLGQRALVLEFRHQPYVCTPCNVATAMGTTISQDHSVAIQSTQTSAHPCVLCRRRREVSLSPTMDRRCLAHASPHFPLPVLCRPCCIPLQP